MSAQQIGDLAEVKFTKYTRLTVGQLKCTSNFSRQITSAGAEISHALLSLPTLKLHRIFTHNLAPHVDVACFKVCRQRVTLSLSCEISAPAEVICLEKLEVHFN